MNRLALGLGLSLSLCASEAYADTTNTVFQTIDSANRAYDTLALTGILAGAATATTTSFPFWTSSSGSGSDGNYAALLNSCTQSATLMMNRPGRFTLTVSVDSDYGGRVSNCTLKRNP